MSQANFGKAAVIITADDSEFKAKVNETTAAMGKLRAEMSKAPSSGGGIAGGVNQLNRFKEGLAKVVGLLTIVNSALQIRDIYKGSGAADLAARMGDSAGASQQINQNLQQMQGLLFGAGGVAVGLVDAFTGMVTETRELLTEAENLNRKTDLQRKYQKEIQATLRSQSQTYNTMRRQLEEIANPGDRQLQARNRRDASLEQLNNERRTAVEQARAAGEGGVSERVAAGFAAREQLINDIYAEQVRQLQIQQANEAAKIAQQQQEETLRAQQLAEREKMVAAEKAAAAAAAAAAQAAREQAEREQRRQQVAEANYPLKRDIAVQEAQLSLEGVELQKRLIEIDRTVALRRAAETGENTDLINRLYNLKLQAATAAQAVQSTVSFGSRGSFGTRSIERAFASSNGPDKQLDELKRINDNTKGLRNAKALAFVE